MAIKKRKMAMKFMTVCLGILLMIPAFVACGVRQEKNIGQTVGGEGETTRDEKNTIDEAMTKDDLRPQTNISAIRITNGDTGEERLLTKENDSEDFWEIIAKWENLDVEKSENQTRAWTSGKGLTMTMLFGIKRVLRKYGHTLKIIL